MYKLLIMLPVLLLMFACNTGTAPSDKEATNHDEQAHEKAGTGLTLNQGKKWKADEATNKNVAALKTITQDFAKEAPHDLHSYKLLGNELQKGLDTMILECKMKGPEHDALHKWLQPLIGSVAELKKAGDLRSAEKIVQAINNNLELYPQYFD